MASYSNLNAQVVNVSSTTTESRFPSGTINHLLITAPNSNPGYVDLYGPEPVIAGLRGVVGRMEPGDTAEFDTANATAYGITGETAAAHKVWVTFLW